MIKQKIISLYILCLKSIIKYYNCDDKLLDIISKYIPFPILELSCKYIKKDFHTYIRYRYILCISFIEFMKIPIKDIHKILEILNFNKEDLIKFIDIFNKISKIDENTDIIFGLDSDIGKIYFDNEDYMMCFETNGNIKHYTKINNNKIKVINQKGELHGFHVRSSFIKSLKTDIYWTNEINSNNYSIY